MLVVGGWWGVVLGTPLQYDPELLRFFSPLLEEGGRRLSRYCHDYRFFETIKNEPFSFHQKPIFGII